MPHSRSLPRTSTVTLPASPIVSFVIDALEHDSLALDLFRREERRGGVRPRKKVDGEVEVEEE